MIARGCASHEVANTPRNHAAERFSRTTLVEAEHPRNVAGRFADKRQSAPELTLCEPPLNLLGEDTVIGLPEASNAYRANVHAQHAHTPITPEDEVGHGECRHIGDGVWMTRCVHCTTYVKTFGYSGIVRELIVHETVHDDTPDLGLAA